MDHKVYGINLNEIHEIKKHAWKFWTALENPWKLKKNTNFLEIAVKLKIEIFRNNYQKVYFLNSGTDHCIQLDFQTEHKKVINYSLNHSFFIFCPNKGA